MVRPVKLFIFNYLGLAERVGFEPTCRLPDKTLSRRPRYDHFGTSPGRVQADLKVSPLRSVVCTTGHVRWSCARPAVLCAPLRARERITITGARGGPEGPPYARGGLHRWSVSAAAGRTIRRRAAERRAAPSRRPSSPPQSCPTRPTAS